MAADHGPIIRPDGPILWVRLAGLQDATALERGQAILDEDVFRLGFDCDWSGGPEMDFLGFEVSRHGDVFRTWTSGGFRDDHASFLEAVKDAFLSGGSLS